MSLCHLSVPPGVALTRVQSTPQHEPKDSKLEQKKSESGLKPNIFRCRSQRVDKAPALSWTRSLQRACSTLRDARGSMPRPPRRTLASPTACVTCSAQQGLSRGVYHVYIELFLAPRVSRLRARPRHRTLARPALVHETETPRLSLFAIL